MGQLLNRHFLPEIRIRDAIASRSHWKILIRNALCVRNACTDQWGHLVEIYKKPFYSLICDVLWISIRDANTDQWGHKFKIRHASRIHNVLRINGSTWLKYIRSDSFFNTQCSTDTHKQWLYGSMGSLFYYKTVNIIEFLKWVFVKIYKLY
jgi:hypothetical protein